MIGQILLMLGLTILQNASFTLVSRARNSSSLIYHLIASILSNGIWLLVIRQVVVNLNNWQLMVTYVVGAVSGSLGMHFIAMKYFEKKKADNKEKAVIKEQLRTVKTLKNFLLKAQHYELAELAREYEGELVEKLEVTKCD